MKLIDYILPYFKNNDKLQVLFFFDNDRSYESEIEELSESNSDVLIKVCKEDWFSQKVWLQENKSVPMKILYYPARKRPETQEEKEDFGLIGELLANEELQIDDAAVIIQELKINVSMKPLVNKYLSELKKTNVQNSLKGLFLQSDVLEKDIQRGLIGAILNAKALEDWTVVMMRLVAFSLDEYAVKWNKRYERIKDANLIDALNDKVKIYFGTVLKTGSHDELKELALRVKYNLITQGLDLNDKDPYSVYKIKDAFVLLNLEQIKKMLYNESKVSVSFIEAMQKNGENIKESKLVECYGYNVTYNCYNDALRLCLLSTILNDYLKKGKDVRDALLILKQHIKDNSAFRETIEFLLNGITLSDFIQSYRSFSFDNNPVTFVKKYIGAKNNKEHYSKIDFLYRKSLYHFRKKGAYDKPDYKELYEEFDEGLNQLKKNIEVKYLNMVYDLNTSWMKSLKAFDFDYQKIKEACVQHFPLQYDFFNDNVAKETNKIAVIISDGLRYEIAEELAELLQQKKGNIKTELAWNLASIPSTTLFGMANLLPSKESKYLGKKGIEIENISTNGMSNRAAILELSQKNTGKSTRVISAEEVKNNATKDNREIFKANIVYVYHDEIDSISHSTGKEYHAIEGSETAIQDLDKLVTKIIGSNVTKIIITADHGFLYRESKIKEQDKIDWNSVNLGVDSTIEQGARHTVINKHIAPLTQGYAFDLKNTTKYKEYYQVHTPVSTNRLKGRGVTYGYTHGGASLQELVVPVLTISSMTSKESRERQKVNIKLVSDRLSVKSNVLKDVQFIQSDSISAFILKRKVDVALYEGKECVSNKKILEFESTSEKPSERIQSVSLTLQKKTSGSLLTLRAYDVEDRLNPLIEASVKNNTLIERDFDF